MLRSLRGRHQRESDAFTSEGSLAPLRSSLKSRSSLSLLRSSSLDETADAPKAPLIQSMASRFESLLSAPNRRKRNVESVVLKIEQTRRHHETKIFERCYTDAVRCEKLCSTLARYLRFASFSPLVDFADFILSSKDISPDLQDYASNEVVRLVVTDPVVRRSMDNCHFADELLLGNPKGLNAKPFSLSVIQARACTTYGRVYWNFARKTRRSWMKSNGICIRIMMP